MAAAQTAADCSQRTSTDPFVSDGQAAAAEGSTSGQMSLNYPVLLAEVDTFSSPAEEKASQDGDASQPLLLTTSDASQPLLLTTSESPVFSDTDEPHSHEYDGSSALGQTPTAMQSLSPAAATGRDSAAQYDLSPLESLAARADQTPQLMTINTRNI
jgi:hypothetical protein